MKALRTKLTHLTILGAALVLLSGAATAYADMVDLTSAGSSGTANDAWFYQIDPRPTGTGYIDPFLRLGTGKDNYEQGYNTSVKPFEYDQKDPTGTFGYTRDLYLNEVPQVDIGGTLYREFLLDINQLNTADGRMLSLDVLKIYLRETAYTAADITGNGQNLVFPSLGTMIWDLDGNGDNFVKMNYDLNTGSGSGDVAVYIPDALFTLAGVDNPAVYLFSGFGANFEANDGFEEWWIGKAENQPVPEPGTMILLGAGFLGLAIYGKRRRNNA